MELDISSIADVNFKPNLYQVHLLLEETIVREHEARLAVFTNWILGHRHVNLAGPRASGKTMIANAVAKFLPNKHGLYNISSGSQKSGWYQAEALRQHSHVMIPELNKMPKEMLEVIKDWGEGRHSEYKVVVFEGGNRRLQTYRLPVRPFIFCLADEQEEKIDDQLRSRLTVIRTDSSENQNVAVNIQQAQLALLPDNPYKVKDERLLENMKHHVATLPQITKIDFRHPASMSFVKAIPTSFTDCRRDYPKYLSNTYGITRFFWKERIKYKQGDKEIYLVTPEDMYLNHIIYGNALIESSMRCSNIERALIEILQQSDGAMNRNTIQAQVRQRGLNISAHMITRHLTALSDLGYILCEKIGSQLAVYSPGPLFQDFNFEVDWKKIIVDSIDNIKKYYPEYSYEYIKKFCTNPTTRHPFTGEEIKIKEIKYEPMKKRDTFQTYEDKLPSKARQFTKREIEGDLIIEEVVPDEGMEGYFK